MRRRKSAAIGCSGESLGAKSAAAEKRRWRPRGETREEAMASKTQAAKQMWHGERKRVIIMAARRRGENGGVWPGASLWRNQSAASAERRRRRQLSAYHQRQLGYGVSIGAMAAAA